MGTTLVNLDINPCKMCMPMGAASAFSGLKNCMTILHGSQGCATYIRRHMATHYNEPVDIASSSLTEHGTVFGGEANLIKGIENLIALYDPDIIGVATTCLAETIGEDVEAIIQKFYQTHPDAKVKIINVASAGYGGTQYEGFLKALRSAVSQVEMDETPNDYINVITPMLSPADYRLLKSLFASMGLKCILLPDLSENLDGVHKKNYERLKSGGTSLEEISKMAGAKHSIELSLFASDESSPAQYLFDKYKVPFTRMALPVGIRDTDAFLDVLVSLGGKRSMELINERGRYLDAMIDSHKYCADGRAAIFGEPDFVYSATRLCCENGLVPLVIATGSECSALAPMLQKEAQSCADIQFAGTPIIRDDCDFEEIEALSKEQGVNIMIGSSDARRIAHRLNIGLVRCAFPIHDRVGGQRMKTILYEGSLNILDQAANMLLAKKEESFRDVIYEKHFGKKSETPKPAAISKTIAEKTETHPCYNCSGGKYARMHLPIAPQCNIQCNYCVRKFDCPNESRPGVTTEVLSPEEAFEKFKYVKSKIDNLTVVGIAGPGDALANFDKTREALRLIHEEYPDVTFCLSTNGLMLPLYAQELIDLGVSHVTVTMNTVDPEIGAKIYKHIDFLGHRYTGVAGASILLANQLTGIRYLASKGIVCKVNSVVLKGLNDHCLEDVVKTAADAGAYISNIMQLIPVAGSAFENMELVSLKEINEIRKTCGEHLKQMYHCKQCRADAIGELGDDRSIDFRGCGSKKTESKPKAKRYAVATKSGMLVDQHFGQATEFYIYESDGSTLRFIEKRPVSKYCTGSDDCLDDKESKMDAILAAVSDCNGVLALRIGNSPSKKLEAMGVEIITTYDRIEDAVKKAAS